MNKSVNKQGGFSLIEVMVVVVILGILAAIVVPKIATRPDEARIIKAKQDILTLENALELYQLDNGIYPSTEQGLQSLVQMPESSPRPANWRPYIKSLPKDPWGREYIYIFPGQHGEFDIFTYGATGQADGEGTNSTIGNWAIH